MHFFRTTLISKDPKLNGWTSCPDVVTCQSYNISMFTSLFFVTVLPLCRINNKSFSPYIDQFEYCAIDIFLLTPSFESVGKPVKIVPEAFKMRVLNAGWRDIFNNDHTKPFTSWVKNVAERNDQNKNCTIIMLTSEKDTKNKMFLIGGLTEPSTFYASHNQGFEDTYISTQ